MITTQLLPAAGLLPFVFTQSCEVKEVGESCRYVCLAVWISGIRYPEVFFFFFTTLPAWRNWRREKKFWKNHTAPSKERGGRLLTQAVWEQVWSSDSASLHALFFVFNLSHVAFDWLKNELWPWLPQQMHFNVFTMWCLFWMWQIREVLRATACTHSSLDFHLINLMQKIKKPEFTLFFCCTYADACAYYTNYTSWRGAKGPLLAD